MCKCDPRRHASCGCKITRYDNIDKSGWLVYKMCERHSRLSGVAHGFKEFKQDWVELLKDEKV